MDAVLANGAVEAESVADDVARGGSAAHPHPHALTGADRPALRDLADAVHHLLMLHGRSPGVIDLAGARLGDPAAFGWAAAAADAFAAERTLLNRLVVAAGPLPSTPGHGESGAAVLAQCHGLEMLARSDRAGCAQGAALALALDWRAVRPVLDTAAARLGVPAPAWALAVPEPDAPAPLARAIRFGARQLLVQHRALWDLLEARARARDAA